MTIREFMKKNIVILDGSMGTMLAKYGLDIANEGTETWNISHPEIVEGIHEAYYNAGSNIVITNTFAAGAMKYPEKTKQERIIMAAYDNAARAREKSGGNQPKFIAYDIGPTGALLEPFGDLEFEEAVDGFAQGVRIAAKTGVDLIMIETMMDVAEAKAAVIAAKENSDLPVFVSHTYMENGHIMMGADPETVIKEMEALGVDAVGINCSFGPKALKKIAEAYIKTASVPVSFKPNAGLPRKTPEGTFYDVSAEEFATEVAETVQNGIRLAGGCCGTTPEYIKSLVNRLT